MIPTFLFGIGLAQGTLCGEDGNAPGGKHREQSMAVNQSLDYPPAIEVPKDLPSFERVEMREKDGTKQFHVFIPRADYLYGHFDGWQSCVLIASSGFDAVERAQAPVASTSNRAWNRGLREGFTECAARIKKLKAAGVTAEELKGISAHSYLPRVPAPPQAVPKR